MNKTTITAISGCLVLCMTSASAVSGEPNHYDIALQPGNHIIIVNAPERRVIRIDTEHQHKLAVEAADGLPFVHLEIAAPSLEGPVHRLSTL